MNAEASGSTPPSGPNPELISVLVNAQKLALRLRNEQVHDVHLLWALLGSRAVSPEDNAFASAGVRKNTVFLAIKSTFGEGSKKDDKAATFTTEARGLYDSTIVQAANDGRQASPADILKNLLQSPSTATRLVLQVIVEDHLQRNGPQNIARARTEVWAWGLAERELVAIDPTSQFNADSQVFLHKVGRKLDATA